MRDIPVFTTEAGVASLILKEIPYTAEAYIKLQDSQDPRRFLKECCDFCTAVGAQRIYASGHAILESYPLHTQLWRMCRMREGLPETDAALFPVQKQTLELWRELYNDKMHGVPNASYMTRLDAQKMLTKGNGYFVHRDDTLLGIGVASGDRIDAVIAAIPGAGKDVLLALCHALTGEQVTLEVASVNRRAIRLYEQLDFLKTYEVSRWYRLL